MQLNLYPGFNGQFTRPVLKIGVGSFLNEPADILKYAIACNPKPTPECKKKGVQEIISSKVEFKATDTAVN